MPTEITTGLALVQTHAAQLAADMDTCSPGRTEFTIRHFVVGQHDTKARQWRQAVLEMSQIRSNVDRALINRERIGLDLADIGDRIGSYWTSARNRKRAELDLAEKHLEDRENERAILGYIRQFRVFVTVWEELGRFTHEELEGAEPEYWTARLTRQAALDVAAHDRIGVGNLDAMRQADIDPGAYSAALAVIHNAIELTASGGPKAAVDGGGSEWLAEAIPSWSEDAESDRPRSWTPHRLPSQPSEGNRDNG